MFDEIDLGHEQHNRGKSSDPELLKITPEN